MDPSEEQVKVDNGGRNLRFIKIAVERNRNMDTDKWDSAHQVILRNQQLIGSVEKHYVFLYPLPVIAW
jgi:hypothetical protein